MADARVFELDLPLALTRRGQVQPGPPLTSNEIRRMHWRQERPLIQLVREAARLRALEAKIPTGHRLTVGLHYAPGPRGGRFDPSNLMPTQKRALDGVVRAGVVPDDSPRWVTEVMPTIHTGPGPRRLWLRIELETQSG